MSSSTYTELVTVVFIYISDGKYTKLMMWKKSKNQQENSQTEKPVQPRTQKKLPLLLPRSSFLNKKGK